MNILIVVNAVVYNRGSEALIRGITKICKTQFPNSKITLVSSEENFGKWINLEHIDKYVQKISYKKKSFKRYIVAFIKKILKKERLANKIKYRKLLEISKEQDIIFIVGADNYDITYNMQNKFHEFNSLIRNNTNAKMILYDCSFDSRDITEILKKDLKNFDYITVRESISKANIEKYIEKEKLYYFPDPAFVMDTEEIEIPKSWKHNKMIGVNVSNLITDEKYGSKLEIILETYDNMLKYILDNTDYNIVLIPHVMNNADLETLKLLYKKYEDNDRVLLIDNQNLNAKQLKYLISNCNLYVGARTHSTIAAYSTYIPTLVLGYSVKSKGIAKDLFGTDKNYVLSVSNMETTDYLVNGLKWLIKNKDEIKKRLNIVIPEYKEKVEEISKILKDI